MKPFLMPERVKYYDIDNGPQIEQKRYEKKMWKCIEKIKKITEKEKKIGSIEKRQIMNNHFDELFYWFERSENSRWEEYKPRKDTKIINKKELLKIAENYIERNFIKVSKEDEISILIEKIIEHVQQWAVVYRKRERRDEDMYNWMGKIMQELNLLIHVESDEKKSEYEYKEYVKRLIETALGKI